MKALILAGGLGTRLRPVIAEKPKPLAEISRKPFINYILEWLKNNNITDVVILAGYKSEQIIEHVGNGSRFGLNVAYSIENNLLGTAGSVKNAEKEISKDNDFLLINGDTYFDLDLKSFLSFHKKTKSAATIALKLVDSNKRYGSINFSNDFRISGFFEKKTADNSELINGGVYAINRRVLDMIPKGKQCSIEKEIFPKLASEGYAYGFPDSGNFIDIGIPEDYKKAQECIPKWQKIKKRSAVFLDRDGVIIEDKGYVKDKSEVHFLPGAIDAVKKINNSGRLCIIATNQSGIGYGYYTLPQMKFLEKWIENQMKKEGAKIDGFYYCPYHPDAIIQKYKRNLIYRKPQPGMILEAAEEHSINLSESFMIGDKSTDIIHLPQLKSYTIKSKYLKEYDFESLNEAIEHLLQNKKKA
jgi:D,D-heptose 1,7-bisphosphate phosphatase